jgi:hypothetical protein
MTAKVIGCIIAIPVIGGLWYLSVLLFRFVWNYVVGGIFHGPHISFWGAVAVMVLLTFIGGYFKSSKD